MAHAMQAEKLIFISSKEDMKNPKPKKAGILDVELLESAAGAEDMDCSFVDKCNVMIDYG